MSELLIRDPASSARQYPDRVARGSSPRVAGTVAPAAAHPQLREISAQVAEALAAVAPHAGALEFEVDQGQTIVRVVDRETKQLVRQIPSEEMVEIRRALERVQGILIRSKA